MTKKKQGIILTASIIMLLLIVGGYFWYHSRYDECYAFYETRDCGIPEDECTFKNILFYKNWCD